MSVLSRYSSVECQTPLLLLEYKVKKGKLMSDYFDYYDEIYTDIYLEFGAEAVSDPAYAEELLSKSQR